VPPEVLRPVVERVGGNPLYAEELVRLLQDRDLLVGTGDTLALRAGEAVPLPDSISALIAARLDTLSPERKSILADAAVIGKVFWAGAVAAMGEREPDLVLQSLRELARKELIRPFRRSSIEGETEYAFWHALTRDVAYAALPRASRVTRHVAAARWIESRAGERVENAADVLAHHYSTAVDLCRASGDVAQAAALEAPAFRFLSLAGERSLGLDAAAALPSLERALDLVPEGHPDRPAALARFGEAAYLAGRYGEAIAALDEAVTAFRGRGDIRAATRAMLTLALPLGRVGDPRNAVTVSEATELIDAVGPCEEYVAALSASASRDAIGGRPDSALVHAERALTMAQELGLPRPARALGFRGMARCTIGDPAGLDDFREAIVLAGEAGQSREGAVLRSNLAGELFNYVGVPAAIEASADAIEYARSRGMSEMVTSIRVATMFTSFAAGDFDGVLALADELGPGLDAGGAVEALAWCRSLEAHVYALRGHAERTRPWLDWLEQASRGTQEPQTVAQGLEAVAAARAALREIEHAASLLEEAYAFPGVVNDANHEIFTPVTVRTALGIRGPEFAEGLLKGMQPFCPFASNVQLSARAAITEARGDLRAAVALYRDAADRWEAFGMAVEHAFARLGLGRCLVRLGRADEAQAAVVTARAIFTSLRAEPSVAEADALMAEIAVA
jgi:tetratricopeptide (TPR) repeat protein